MHILSILLLILGGICGLVAGLFSVNESLRSNFANNLAKRLSGSQTLSPEVTLNVARVIVFPLLGAGLVLLVTSLVTFQLSGAAILIPTVIGILVALFLCYYAFSLATAQVQFALTNSSGGCGNGGCNCGKSSSNTENICGTATAN